MLIPTCSSPARTDWTSTFQAQGDQSLLKEMRTDGRSVATLSAPKSRANDPRAASKRLTADAIKMIWRVERQGSGKG